MNPLPKMPSARRSRPTHACACGCGAPTKRTWFPGHDGRATGWALRVERGVIGLGDVPTNERAGAVIMLERRGTYEMVIRQGNPRKQRVA